MRSLFDKKPLVLLLSILALGALTVLSVSLRSVSFEEAQPIGHEEAEPFLPTPQGLSGPLTEESGQFQILFWGAMALLLVLTGFLLSPEMRKRMIRLFIRAAFFLWLVDFIIRRRPDLIDVLDPANYGNVLGHPNADAAALPPPVFTPPQLTPWMSYLVSVLVVLAAFLLIWKLYRTWRKLNPDNAGSIQEIAKVARASLRDLSDGRESTDVILNCYFRMSDVVADRKRLRRETAMTPAEFAHRLEQSGLPGDAVRRLTRLFESVRYGSHRAGPQETNEAVACLTTILQYCGEPV